MKRIILFSAFLLLCFAGCKTTESIDPSYELSSNIEDHKQPSQAADSESSIEFSSEELDCSLSQPEKASSEPNN